MHNRKKDNNNKFKNKKQPQLPENKTVWKSNNQVVKEETFIHTGKRGRDEQLGLRGHPSKQRLADRVGKVVSGGLGGPTCVCG